MANQNPNQTPRHPQSDQQGDQDKLRQPQHQQHEKPGQQQPGKHQSDTDRQHEQRK